MKLNISWVSGKKDSTTITINTLEELFKLIKKEKHSLVIGYDGKNNPNIYVYDDYME